MIKDKRRILLLKLSCLSFGLLGISMLAPLLLSLFCKEDFGFTLAFIASAILGLGFGSCTFLLKRVWRSAEIFRSRDGFLSVLIIWMLISLYSSLPYLFSPLKLSFTQALYESMSGFTTTGSSVFSNVEALPKSILLWRALTQWFGGIGIIVFIMAIMPSMGNLGTSSFSAEMTGLVQNRINPRMKDTAKSLFLVYLFLTITQCILLCLCKMPIFDSICHSMTTVATGGFSNYNQSLCNTSASVQWVCSSFMFLSGINYMLYYFLFIKKDAKKLLKDEEFRSYALYVAICITLFFIVLYLKNTASSFRLSVFHIVSMASTTGFTSSNLDTWPSILKCILYLIMFIGACSGSSSGAMKTSRMLILFKSTLLEFRRAAHPRAILPLKYNNSVLSDEMVRKVHIYFFLYMASCIFACIVFSFLGFSPYRALILAISNVCNIGVVHATGFTSLTMWISMFLMLVGRLGIFTVLLILTPSFWKNR